MRNPIDKLILDPKSHFLLHNRLNVFSNSLNIPRQRLKDWSYVQAVLAALWSHEDNGDWSPWIRYLDILENEQKFIIT